MTQSKPLFRRDFIRGGMMIGAGLALLPYGRQSLASTLSDDFMRLSLLLTGRTTLSSAQGERIYRALILNSDQFPSMVKALQQAIAGDGFTDMINFHAFAGRHQAQIRDTAMTIISAWYLGYAGTPSHSGKDDARFIAFQDALMYQPTLDATVIPTYSRGETNYWVNPPASIARD